jgi:hypothetical protein
MNVFRDKSEVAVEVDAREVVAEDGNSKTITTIKTAGTLADDNLKKDNRYTQIWP